MAPTGASISVSAGIWSGDHVRLTVSGTASTVEFDCAHGTLPAPIPVHDGAFDVTGVLVIEHGGPIRQDENLPRETARYSGTVTALDMTLRVTLADTGEVVGDYTLRLGGPARLFKCL
jgi:hypothetical protein